MCSGSLHIVQVDVPHTFGYLVLCVSVLCAFVLYVQGVNLTYTDLIPPSLCLSMLCLCTVRSGGEPHTSRTISHKSDELR